MGTQRSFCTQEGPTGCCLVSESVILSMQQWFWASNKVINILTACSIQRVAVLLRDECGLFHINEFSRSLVAKSRKFNWFGFYYLIFLQLLSLLSLWEDCTFLPCSSHWLRSILPGFPGVTVGKNPPANTGDTGSIPGPRKFHTWRSN